MDIDAMAAQTAGGALAPFTYQPAPLAEHDCEVTVTHCGICHSDLHLLNDDWGITRFPFVPGHEVVGTVSAAGPRSVHAAGTRVAIGWQRSACLECDLCRAGHENLCPDREATCVRHHGGFADRIRVDSRFAFALPDALDSAAAAPLLCGGITVFSPLRRYGAAPGMRVGVVGIGGLGHLALKFARALGAEVTALSSSPGKEADAHALGAHAFVHTGDAAAVKAARGSFDLLLSTVSADQPWESFLQLLRVHGTLCLVGVPPNPLSFSVDALMKTERAVSASAIGSPARIREMLIFAAHHRIGAEVEQLPLASANEGLARLAANRARYRVVLHA